MGSTLIDAQCLAGLDETLTVHIFGHFSYKIMVWHFLLISPVSSSPSSLLTCYCVPDCQHCAHVLVSVSDGVHVLTLLLSRKSLCYLLQTSLHTIQSTERGRENSYSQGQTLLCHTLSFFLPLSFYFSDLQRARTHQKLYRQTPEHLCMSPCSVFECVYARLWVWFWERGIMIMQHIQIIYWGISSVLYKSVTLGRSQPEWWRGPTPPFVFLSHSLHSHRVPTALQHKRNVPF